MSKTFFEKPCDQCPFRCGQEKIMSPGHAREVFEDLKRDGWFICHKTVDYDGVSDEDEEWDLEEKPQPRQPGPDEKMCAGSAVLMLKAGLASGNRAYRTAIMLGLLEQEKLEKHYSLVADDLDAWLAAAIDSNDSRDRAVLREAGVPLPEGAILRTRWIASRDDWYVLLSDGWHWYDARLREWKHCPNGVTS